MVLTKENKQTNKKFNNRNTWRWVCWLEMKNRKFGFHQGFPIPWTHIELMKTSPGISLAWKGAHSSTSLVKMDKPYPLERGIWGTFLQSQIHPDSRSTHYISVTEYWIWFYFLTYQHTLFTHTEPAVTWNRFC